MSPQSDADVVVFLTGDVMTGRGIDQILPHPGDPTLQEAVVTDARTYIRLAEQTNGHIPAPVDFTWPWGEAVPLLDEMRPDIRLINLETSITTSSAFAPRKAVHYRMHPQNAGCLDAVAPVVCALANNHVLDFGDRGLVETLRVLSGTPCAGAGLNVTEAERVAKIPLPADGRALVSSIGAPSSGIPPGWAATADRPGVAFVGDLSESAASAVARRTVADKEPGDVAIVSVHWGSNWGYEVGDDQIRFAHRLIDDGIDVVHGHSSHHARPIEVYRDKLILYGCGDTLDDYEGIGTYESFRHELRLLYFASIARPSGRLTGLTMVPMKMRRMRLERVGHDDGQWLRATVEQASRRFRTQLREASDGVLQLVQ